MSKCACLFKDNLRCFLVIFFEESPFFAIASDLCVLHGILPQTGKDAEIRLARSEVTEERLARFFDMEVGTLYVENRRTKRTFLPGTNGNFSGLQAGETLYRERGAVYSVFVSVLQWTPPPSPPFDDSAHHIRKENGSGNTVRLAHQHERVLRPWQLGKLLLSGGFPSVCHEHSSARRGVPTSGTEVHHAKGERGEIRRHPKVRAEITHPAGCSLAGPVSCGVHCQATDRPGQEKSYQPGR